MSLVVASIGAQSPQLSLSSVGRAPVDEVYLFGLIDDFLLSRRRAVGDLAGWRKRLIDRVQKAEFELIVVTVAYYNNDLPCSN